MSYYLSQFFNLKCAGDILNISNPIGNSPEKEISEGMSIRNILKPFSLDNPHKYSIIEFCAGNALPSLLAVFTLPIRHAIAIDKKERNRRWDLVRNFQYKVENIENFSIDKVSKDDIIIGMHPCGGLAKKIIEVWNNSPSPILILCPCCTGQLGKEETIFPNWIKNKYKISKYDLWTLNLGKLIKGEVKFTVDGHLLSPRNNIIIGEK